MTLGSDAKRLAIELIATLVNAKKTAADQLLRWAGVNEQLIKRFLTDRDPATGSKRSKCIAAAVLLEELAGVGRDEEVIRNLIAIASDWTSFHLAQNEYQARAVVQKAVEFRGVLEANQVRARTEAKAELKAAERDRARQERDIRAKQSALLLAQFDHIAFPKIISSAAIYWRTS